MPYKNPLDVASPKDRWNFIALVYDLGIDDHCLAVGEWDGDLCLATRWNGNLDGDNPKGNPISNFQPTWFILPHLQALAIFKELCIKVQLGDDSINLEALRLASPLFS